MKLIIRVNTENMQRKLNENNSLTASLLCCFRFCLASLYNVLAAVKRLHDTKVCGRDVIRISYNSSIAALSKLSHLSRNERQA